MAESHHVMVLRASGRDMYPGYMLWHPFTHLSKFRLVSGVRSSHDSSFLPLDSQSSHAW